jgi:hypothetical protein
LETAAASAGLLAAEAAFAFADAGLPFAAGASPQAVIAKTTAAARVERNFMCFLSGE